MMEWPYGHQVLDSICQDSVISKSPPWQPTSNALFWWNSTSVILRQLLVHGRYSVNQQRVALDFYQQFVVANLGPRPAPESQLPTWRSFMTDDFTPIEFSWNWGNAQGKVDSRVRFSIEPISEQAGTVSDPWNRIATLELVDRLESVIPDIDLKWFRFLSGKVTPSACTENTLSKSHPEQPRSCMFLAFEIGDQLPVVKAYMLPFGKAIETSQANSAVIFNSLASLASDELKWPSLQMLVQSLETRCDSFQLDPFMLAFDCVAPSNSRMKIYARCPDTHLTTAEAIMSMFDDNSKIGNGLKELRTLWSLVFSPNSSKEREPGRKGHDTSGILYYFEVRPGSSKVTTKIYLPVKHYGRDDLSIAKGLQVFFEERNHSQDQIAKDYLQALRQICTYRRLDSATGLQTYISCKIENDSLSITSYLSPEIFNKGRWSPITATV